MKPRDMLQFPEDSSDDTWYASFIVECDHDGDFFIFQEKQSILMSITQARALHQELGQLIVRNDRYFGFPSDVIKEVHTNDDRIQ